MSARHTGLGALAILSWGTLGALGAFSASLPPYLVLTFCFAVAAAMGLVICAATGRKPVRLLDRRTVLFAGLLAAYHLVYLEAFHHAAPIPVSLINYLWPACLIILGNLYFQLRSGFPGYLGAALGFVGVLVLIGKDGFVLQLSEAFGYGLAFVGALLWATFSNLRRHDSSDAISAMTTICFASSLICGLWWMANGANLPALTAQDVWVIAALGLGPAGGAFFLWDLGMRQGHAALLGVLGYSAPVLSTILMLVLGLGQPGWKVFAAIALITLGGIVVQIGTSATSSGKLKASAR
ncbi:Aromatic amino acid exporter YddG [Phaeobacter italicus]|uniref:Aromatic amino acid exporter YddG n=1 Tax=Phaeobacter italicus TaxID=481446 RepID=A0A0H5D7Y3_9RHOB|nr:EamA family transporter [Phaeobacter italicus]CRL12818.1 Aromatic amino acid exporter YddG [Phaeobacter italicus]